MNKPTFAPLSPRVAALADIALRERRKALDLIEFATQPGVKLTPREQEALHREALAARERLLQIIREMEALSAS
jgi:hypothetical protein